jgi:hypothetical protein
MFMSAKLSVYHEKPTIGHTSTMLPKTRDPSRQGSHPQSTCASILHPPSSIRRPVMEVS